MIVVEILIRNSALTSDSGFKFQQAFYFNKSIKIVD